MAGALGLGGDLTGWTDAELDEAAGLVTVYKEVRPWSSTAASTA